MQLVTFVGSRGSRSHLRERVGTTGTLCGRANGHEAPAPDPSAPLCNYCRRISEGRVGTTWREKDAEARRAGVRWPSGG